MTPDDRPGVSRQVSSIPEEVRKATAALTSDADYAVLNTIHQSGVTRFSWLHQELQIPNQEIVEALGRLYSIELIERTSAGHGAGRESAYVVTDMGERVLRRLQDDDEPEPDPEPEAPDEPQQTRQRRKHGGKPLQKHERPRKKHAGRPKNMTDERDTPRKKHPSGGIDFFAPPSRPSPDDDSDDEDAGTDTSLTIHDPIE